MLAKAMCSKASLLWVCWVCHWHVLRSSQSVEYEVKRIYPPPLFALLRISSLPGNSPTALNGPGGSPGLPVDYSPRGMQWTKKKTGCGTRVSDWLGAYAPSRFMCTINCTITSRCLFHSARWRLNISTCAASFVIYIPCRPLAFPYSLCIAVGWSAASLLLYLWRYSSAIFTTHPLTTQTTIIHTITHSYNHRYTIIPVPNT